MKSERAGRVCSDQLREVLLGRFEGAMRLPIPGGDGLTLDDAVECYVLGMAAGWLPSSKELIAMHPELAEEIQSFLGNVENVSDFPLG